MDAVRSYSFVLTSGCTHNNNFKREIRNLIYFVIIFTSVKYSIVCTLV